MQIDAFLCDHATIREGLLHILGAGISRIGRPIYPAPLGLSFAAIIKLQKSEAAEPHRIKVVVLTEDGESIATIDGGFEVKPHSGLKPGEMLAMPIVLPLSAVGIPKPGTYGIDVLLDGQQVRSFMFVVENPTERKQA